MTARSFGPSPLQLQSSSASSVSGNKPVLCLLPTHISQGPYFSMQMRISSGKLRIPIVAVNAPAAPEPAPAPEIVPRQLACLLFCACVRFTHRFQEMRSWPMSRRQIIGLQQYPAWSIVLFTAKPYTRLTQPAPARCRPPSSSSPSAPCSLSLPGHRSRQASRRVVFLVHSTPCSSRMHDLTCVHSSG